MLGMNNAPDADTALMLGRHMTIEYHGCDTDILRNKTILEQVMLSAARDSGATVISSSFHDFSPQGVSGVVIIAESHFSLHTWPEHEYAAADIFTCGDRIDFDTATSSMKTGFKAGRFHISADMGRGNVSRSGLSHDPSGRVTPPTAMRPAAWKAAFEARNPWAISVSIDLYRCDPDRIRDKDAVYRFIEQLCHEIQVTPTDECRISPVAGNGEHAGMTVTQPIDGALISAHFPAGIASVYLDIVSCTYIDPRPVSEFALSYFDGTHYKLSVGHRH